MSLRRLELALQLGGEVAGSIDQVRRSVQPSRHARCLAAKVEAPLLRALAPFTQAGGRLIVQKEYQSRMITSQGLPSLETAAALQKQPGHSRCRRRKRSADCWPLPRWRRARWRGHVVTAVHAQRAGVAAAQAAHHCQLAPEVCKAGCGDIAVEAASRLRVHRRCKGPEGEDRLMSCMGARGRPVTAKLPAALVRLAADTVNSPNPANT